MQEGQLYIVRDNILKRYMTEGIHIYETTVIPRALIGQILKLAHEDMGHNGIANQSGSTLDVISCKCGPYLSDHCVVNCTTSVVHEEAIRKSITYRKIGLININKFITDCDLLNITLSEVEDMVNAFNNQLKNALNDNAPEITKQVTVRKKVPWFTQEIREKKRVV